MRNNTTKKRILLLISCVLAVCLVAGAIVAASMYIRSIRRGYPLKITSSFVAFTLNGNTYLNDIQSEELTISKGEQCDFTLQVGIKASHDAYVDYQIRFRIEPNPEDAPLTDEQRVAYDALINAIEVYQFDGYTYRYVCQLGEIDSYSFRDELSTDITRDIPYRFVYSPETSAAYDELAADGRFLLRAYADEMEFATIASQKYVYITDAEMLRSYAASDTSVGKTFILVNNITLNSDIVSAGKLSIDLNGYTLDTAGHTFTVRDGGTEEEQAYRISVSAGGRLKTENNVSELVVGELVGNGLTLPEGVALIDRSLADAVQYTLPADDSVLLSQFTSILSERVKLLDGGKNYRFGDDVSFLFTGLEYLLGEFDGTDVSGGRISLRYDDQYLNDGFVKIQYDPSTGFTVSDASDAVTSRYSFLLVFNAGSRASSVSGAITLQGRSAFAIAEKLGKQIPELLSHSYILKTYDSETAANVEWLVYDQYDGKLFDQNGIFRREGMEALRLALKAKGQDYYTARELEIYVKVSKGVDSCTHYVPGIFARPFSAEELTEYIYNDIAITVGDKVPYLFSTYISSPDEEVPLSDFGLRSIQVEPIVEGEDDASKYLLITEENGYPKLSLKDGVDTNFIGKTQLKITFTYENDDVYTCVRDVTLLGEAKYITAYDVSSALQADFSVNPYVEGRAYEFDAHSVLAPTVSINGVLQQIPVFVDYEVATEEAKRFISITYDYVETPFNELDDFYAYFIYDEQNDCYVFSAPDKDGHFDETKTYYERRAVVEVLPARVSYTDTETAIVNATIFTLDVSDPADRYAPDGTVGGKAVAGKPHTIEVQIDENTTETRKAYYEPASGVKSYLFYPLTLEIAGIITNSEDGLPDYNFYSYLLTLYDGVLDGEEDGILTSKEAQASWDAVRENLARKDKSSLIRTVSSQSELFASTYFTGVKPKGTSSEVFTKMPMRGTLHQNKYVALSDFVDDVTFGKKQTNIGEYATLYANAEVATVDGAYLFVLKKSAAAETITQLADNRWGMLRLNGDEVVSQNVYDASKYSVFANEMTPNDLWDFIKVKYDEKGVPIHPDDANGSAYYSDGTYLPGFYMVFFQNDKATAPSGNYLYNRYRMVSSGEEQGFVHATVADGASIYYSNASIIGPFYSHPEFDSGATYSYLDMDDILVSSLKGLENFPYFQGISLHNSGVSDLSPLEGLLDLTYLDISADATGINTVTNLSPLKYLDSLYILNLQNTNVTTLDEIRYLKSLNTLNISDTSVSDYSAIANLKKLRRLYLTKNGLTNNSEDMYNLALASLNAGQERFFVNNGTDLVSISDIQRVLAAVMHDLENFNRVNDALYLPLTYDYNGTTYDLNWFCSATDLISIDNAGANGQAGYVISHPLFDTPLTISVQVRESDGVYYTSSRVFNVTLEAGSRDTVKYIYDYRNDSYVSIEDVIPDPVLRNLIFSTFNSAEDTQGFGGSGPGFVISENELESYRSKQLLLNWSEKGITDLTGIEYLYPLFDQESLYLILDLSGNPIDDLRPLNALSLNALVLGGKEYDLSQLSGLTTLYALDVHKCVNISTEQSLRDLYAIYANNNNVYIYKDNAPSTLYYNDPDSAWNPYEELVEKALHAKDSVFGFAMKGDTVDLFPDTDATEFTFNFYGNDLTFSETYEKIYNATPCFTYNSATGIATYSAFNAWEESSMLLIRLSADDGHKGWSVTVEGGNIASYTPIDITVTHDWYVELIALDPGKRVNIYYQDQWQPISDVFSSYEILTGLYNWLFDKNSGFAKWKTAASAQDTIGTNLYFHDDATNVYYIDAPVLKGFTKALSGTLEIKGKRLSGKEILSGVELLGSTTISFARDAELGDGSHLVNIKSITTKNSSIDLGVLQYELPNLETASFLSFSSFTATKEIMRLLPNLVTLKVGEGAENNQTEKVTDWSFLLGLISDGETSLKNLSIKNFINAINSVLVITSAPTNQLTTMDWGYVYTLYRAVEKSGNTPDFVMYVKTTTDNDAPASWAITREDQKLYCGSVLVYNAEDQQSDEEIDTADTYTDAEAFTIVTSFMQDLGLKVNGTYWLDAPVYALTEGDTLTLPANTYNDWFGIEYADGIKKRAFPITWKLYSNATSSNLFTGETVDGTVSLAGYQDRYVVLVGTVTNEGESYSFVYHFAVGDDRLYTEVADTTLRLWLFANCATINGTPAQNDLSTLDFSAGISDASLLELLSERGIAHSVLGKDGTTNFICDLAGFDTVMTASGRNTQVRQIDLSQNKVLTVAELNCLSALETLVLADTSAKLTGYTVPASLTTFSAMNDACFGLDDLAILNGSALTTLNLYGTGTHAREETLATLLSLQDIAAGGSIQLAWNLAEESEVRYSELAALDGVLQGPEFLTMASGFDLSELDRLYVISGCQIDIPSDTRNLLLNFDIAPTVDTVLTVDYIDNSQLFVYHPAVCNRTGASIGYIGTGDTAADRADLYDTELLAYLYKKELLRVSHGNHLVGSGSAEITQNIGIKSPANGTSVRVDGVTATYSNNTLAGAQEQPAASAPNAPGRLPPKDFQDLVYTEPQLEMIDGIFKTVPRDITYAGNSYTLTVDLPKIIMIAGVPYTVTVQPNDPFVGTYTYADGVLALSFGSDLVEGERYTCTYDVELSDGTSTYTVSNLTYYVTRLGGVSTEEQNNFLVEVRYDDVQMTVYMVDEDGNRTVSAKVLAEPKQLYLKNGVYYTEIVPDYEKAIYYTNAANLIRSGRLRTYLYWLSEFNGGDNANYRPFADGAGTLYAPVHNAENTFYGKVLLNDNALQLVNFRQSMDNGLGITSLEGLQMFANMQSFYIMHNGVTDIAPLASLHLKSFQIQNSQDTNNFITTDFTPLLVGSRDTLEEFGYDGNGNVFATDLSFLADMPSLKRVLLGVRYYKVYNKNTVTADMYGDSLTYFKSLPFQYTLATLYNHGVRVYVDDRFIRIQNGLFKLDYTQSYVWNNYRMATQNFSTDPSALSALTTLETATLYAILPQTFDCKAAEILDELSGAYSPDRRLNHPYSEFRYGYQYLIHDYIAIEGTSQVSVYLPASIICKGEMFAVDWHAVTKNVKEIKYVLKRSDDLTEGEEITAERLAELVSSIDFYNAQKAGNMQVYAKITVDVVNPANIAACDYTRLTCNITQEDVVYQRMVTLAF